MENVIDMTDIEKRIGEPGRKYAMFRADGEIVCVYYFVHKTSLFHTYNSKHLSFDKF